VLVLVLVLVAGFELVLVLVLVLVAGLELVLVLVFVLDIQLVLVLLWRSMSCPFPVQVSDRGIACRRQRPGAGVSGAGPVQWPAPASAAETHEHELRLRAAHEPGEQKGAAEPHPDAAPGHRTGGSPLSSTPACPTGQVRCSPRGEGRP
jgi:hypothetical protein